MARKRRLSRLVKTAAVAVASNPTYRRKAADIALRVAEHPKTRQLATRIHAKLPFKMQPRADKMASAAGGQLRKLAGRSPDSAPPPSPHPAAPAQASPPQSSAR